jgi:hypothetical protein
MNAAPNRERQLRDRLTRVLADELERDAALVLADEWAHLITADLRRVPCHPSSACARAGDQSCRLTASQYQGWVADGTNTTPTCHVGDFSFGLEPSNFPDPRTFKQVRG